MPEPTRTLLRLNDHPLNTPELRELIISAAGTAAPVFAAREWKWGRRVTHDLYVPSEADIALTLRELCHDALSQPEPVIVASGRFIVQTDDEGLSITLELGQVDAPDA